MADAGRQAPAGTDDGIKLRVMDQLDNEVNFALRKTTKMGKLMKVYLDRFDLHERSLRFLFDGRRINEDDTPESLEMETDDVIEVVGPQDGGRLSEDDKI